MTIGTWGDSKRPRVVDPRLAIRPRVVDPPSAATPRVIDPLSVVTTLGPEPLEQQLLSCAAGRASARETQAAEEVLFVLSGIGTLHLDGVAHELEPESGAYLEPGESYEIENRGAEPLELVAVRIPPDRDGAHRIGGRRAVVRRLADQGVQDATAAREFRIVADPSTGLNSATHFVGYIPVGRAPDHFHSYDEVIYVFDGQGALLAQGKEMPVRAGSSIGLPARVVHCLENRGPGVMRVVAVFRPAGSPAAAYYTDGTPAHAAAPRLEAS